MDAADLLYSHNSELLCSTQQLIHKDPSVALPGQLLKCEKSTDLMRSHTSDILHRCRQQLWHSKLVRCVVLCCVAGSSDATPMAFCLLATTTSVDLQDEDI
jgi:hypothetical protein